MTRAVYLLDTNVISELRRPQKAPHSLLAWSRQTPPQDLFISCITVFELELGVRLKEHKDSIQGNMLRHWLERQILPQFRTRTIHIDTEIARRCAAMHVPNPAPERDAWIAATALAHDLTVVTRNTRDFMACGARVLNPWQIAAH